MEKTEVSNRSEVLIKKYGSLLYPVIAVDSKMRVMFINDYAKQNFMKMRIGFNARTIFDEADCEKIKNVFFSNESVLITVVFSDEPVFENNELRKCIATGEILPFGERTAILSFNTFIDVIAEKKRHCQEILRMVNMCTDAESELNKIIAESSKRDKRVYKNNHKKVQKMKKYLSRLKEELSEEKSSSNKIMRDITKDLKKINNGIKEYAEQVKYKVNFTKFPYEWIHFKYNAYDFVAVMSIMFSFAFRYSFDRNVSFTFSDKKYDIYAISISFKTNGDFFRLFRKNLDSESIKKTNNISFIDVYVLNVLAEDNEMKLKIDFYEENFTVDFELLMKDHSDKEEVIFRETPGVNLEADELKENQMLKDMLDIFLEDEEFLEFSGKKLDGEE